MLKTLAAAFLADLGAYVAGLDDIKAITLSLVGMTLIRAAIRVGIDLLAKEAGDPI